MSEVNFYYFHAKKFGQTHSSQTTDDFTKHEIVSHTKPFVQNGPVSTYGIERYFTEHRNIQNKLYPSSWTTFKSYQRRVRWINWNKTHTCPVTMSTTQYLSNHCYVITSLRDRGVRSTALTARVATSLIQTNIVFTRRVQKTRSSKKNKEKKVRLETLKELR